MGEAAQEPDLLVVLITKLQMVLLNEGSRPLNVLICKGTGFRHVLVPRGF